jgi:NAD(P)-dependent dehydrogenase (short-subunit alcohol dehydrogenase family)
VKLFEAAGRTALVTGAAGGIGRAVVQLFREAGAGVAAVDLALPDESGDAETLAIQADCTDETAVRNAVAAAVERFKRIDYLVHAVGVVGPGKFMDIDLAHWRRILDLNLTSAFLVCQAAYPHLKTVNGSAVLIASSNALTGGDWVSGPVYAIAKGGIVQMTRYLSREWAPDGIRVNCVAPGPVDTPMLDRLTQDDHAALKAQIPLGRYATTKEVAAAIGFLCSDHSASTTGTVSNITGGRIVD